MRTAFFATLALCLPFALQAQAPPDTLTFTNGDHLSGKLLREADGKVTFHSDVLGDVTVKWSQIQQLKSTRSFAVLQPGITTDRKLTEAQLPIGALHVAAGIIQLTPTDSQATLPPIPVARAEYVVDKPTLDKQLLRSPGLLQAWNGSATGGLTLVRATQNQYTVNTAINLERKVPTVAWLDPRNRTAANLNESFGKITQPAYTQPATATTPAIFIPSSFTQSNIFHADAERDEYVSKRLYYLGTVAFDHNFAQSLQLQQIYGLGVGYTVFHRPKQQLEVQATAQYEKQTFFNSVGGNQNLIAATLAGNYHLTLPRDVQFHQQIEYLPAFNNSRAYSVTEADTLTLPAYKNLGFTVGTLDSYLNNAPISLPPNRRNSFQFNLGITYALKSTY